MPPDHVTPLLEQLAMSMVAATTRAIAASGEDLTFTQWRALVVVGERSDGLALSELADRIAASLSPTSRLVRRMARRGWLELSKADADRRVTVARATESGLALREAVFAARRRHLERAADELGMVTPVDLEFLTRVVEAVSADPARA